MTLEQLIRQFGKLPASQIAVQVNNTLAHHQSLIITAPPGAGKSTLLPLTLLKGMKNSGKILMLEPRRIAARQIAERMADMLGEKVGETVGYRVRFESKVSAHTQIEVLTEGILTRMLVSDATLDGIDMVIFDEFHERSLQSDLAFALARQTQQLIRDDLKLVIMSATINVEDISKAIQAPVIESEGKMYPVEVKYAHEPPDRFHITQAVASAIAKAYREHDGDILAFLPGQAEIIRCEDMLKGAFATEWDDNVSSNNPIHTNDSATTNITSQEERPVKTSIYPLYGNLPQEQQRAAIAPSRNGERKIVLATPIAETSLTIEGVRVVVDSGLCRQLVYEASTDLSHLETVTISQDMATQRMGRAGRLAEGTCYRMWTLATQHQMQEQRKPEIEEADLSSLVLAIAAFGESDVLSLPWLTPPPTGHIMQAVKTLKALGAIAPLDGLSITPLGKKMAQLPCHPRISKMILSAASPSEKSLACDIAALLEEKDPLVDKDDCDISLRISHLWNARKNKNPGKWARIARIAQEYQRMCLKKENADQAKKERLYSKNDNTDVAAEDIGRLVAFAYPERIAKASDNLGNFRLANGQLVRIAPTDALSAKEWIAIASLHSTVNTSATDNAGKVFLAAPLDEQTLEEIAIPHQRISWDSKQEGVAMREERRIGLLVLDSKPMHDIDKEKIKAIVCEAVKKDGLSLLDWNADVQRLQLRVAKVKEWHPELDIPDLSTDHLLNIASEWLPFYLEENGKVKSNANELKKLPLREMIWNILPYDLQQSIEHLAPTHIQVPSGSKIRVDYRQGADAPILSVRLQECFGMKETPCVNEGKQPVLMELLSPGFKPVQLTQDLSSFWKGTYFEVRKELKRRYPKHFWPENPLESMAVKGVKKK